MPNFFEDNEDIQFLFDHVDLAEIATARENGFARTDGPGREYAPLDAEDAVARLRAWLAGKRTPLALCIGGPRESEAPGVYAKAKIFLGAVLDGETLA